jgi:Cu-Zn family superoxide dismutase
MPALRRCFAVLALLISATGLISPVGVDAQPIEAVAEIRDAKGNALGRATFSALAGGTGVWIQVVLAGLSPGVHGISIHENGVCQGPEFRSAGGHFNPRGRRHGLAHWEGANAGDLPNMVVNEAGNARYDAANVRIALGEGPNSLFKPGGTSLVIHALPDDQLTDPDGGAGPGIACGIITRAKS